VLLAVRIFLLPCVTGLLVYSVWNHVLFGYPPSVLQNLLIHNVLGCVGLLWGLGISFMLYSTIALLQVVSSIGQSFIHSFIKYHGSS
jgi:hypothetical protein